jgi:hypothetical protein
VLVLAADENASLEVLTAALDALEMPLAAYEDAEASALVALRAERFRFAHPLARAAV